MSYIQFIDELPWMLKVLLALPGFNVFYGIYRLVKGFNKNNDLLIVAGIIWIFAGWAILWIIDLISVVFNDKITVLA